MTSKILAANYLDMQGKPLVFYELDDMTFMPEGVECCTRLIQNLPQYSVAWQLTMLRPDLRNINAYINRKLLQTRR